MRAFVLLCVLGLALSEEVLNEDFREAATAFDYHQKYGIRAAAEIKAAEESMDFDGSRIIGGTLAFAGTIPHMGGLAIILTNGFTSVCGSTVISNTRAVTAAHCWWDGRSRGHTVTVVMGANTLYFGGVRRATNVVTVHPSWRPESSTDNNVAVITFSRVEFNNQIRNAELPSGAQLNNNFAGSWARAAGFGLLADSGNVGQFQFLYHADLQVITNAQCSRYFSGVTSSMLCTDGVSGSTRVGLCRGDLGGPLAVAEGNRNVLIGIASFFSQSGCTAGRPSGFTRVTSHASWIRSQM